MPFFTYFLSAHMQDLRKTIEMKKEIIRSQNLRSAPKKNVDELKDYLKILEGARNDRMGIYIFIYHPNFYVFVNYPSYEGVETIDCLFVGR